MHYPLHVSFKVLALGSQLTIKDADGNLVCYLKRKLFTLKENITIYRDEAQTQPLYQILADKMMAVSPTYQFTDSAGTPFGSVKCNGWRSLWNIDYEIFPPNATLPTLKIDEENPWIKVIDAVVGEIPLVGWATCFLFHPAYLVKRPDGAALLRLKKEPSFFESKFSLEQLEPLSPDDETRAIVALLVMILAARSRG